MVEEIGRLVNLLDSQWDTLSASYCPMDHWDPEETALFAEEVMGDRLPTEQQAQRPDDGRKTIAWYLERLDQPLWSITLKVPGHNQEVVVSSKVTLRLFVCVFGSFASLHNLPRAAAERLLAILGALLPGQTRGEEGGLAPNINVSGASLASDPVCLVPPSWYLVTGILDPRKLQVLRHYLCSCGRHLVPAQEGLPANGHLGCDWRKPGRTPVANMEVYMPALQDALQVRTLGKTRNNAIHITNCYRLIVECIK